jgi:hypothetical protein
LSIFEAIFLIVAASQVSFLVGISIEQLHTAYNYYKSFICLNLLEKSLCYYITTWHWIAMKRIKNNIYTVVICRYLKLVNQIEIISLQLCSGIRKHIIFSELCMKGAIL